MKKSNVIKFVSFLIILFFIFQLVPSTLANLEGLQSNTQNSKVVSLSGSFNNVALLNGRVNFKTVFQKAPIKPASILGEQFFAADISLTNSIFQEESFDYRKVIRQSIPHYFNGSKYKDTCLVI